MTSAKIQMCVPTTFPKERHFSQSQRSAEEQEGWIVTEKSTPLLNLMICQKDGQVCHISSLDHKSYVVVCTGCATWVLFNY